MMGAMVSPTELSLHDLNMNAEFLLLHPRARVFYSFDATLANIRDNAAACCPRMHGLHGHSRESLTSSHKVLKSQPLGIMSHYF